MQIGQTAEQPVAVTCPDQQGVCMEHGGLWKQEAEHRTWPASAAAGWWSS